MGALISPLIDRHRGLLNFRSALLDDLMIRPNVRIFRYYLNERFDVSLRRITVVDGPEGDVVRIYTEGENQPVYLPRFLSAIPIDFEVRLPVTLRPFEAEIIAFIERYKLPTKTYTLTYFLVDQND